jgi:putative ABC transport system substrate-binding protein
VSRYRRWLATGAIAFLVAVPLSSSAQHPAKVPRVGYLGDSSPALERELVEAFRQRLGDLGYVDGQNVVIEYRSAEEKRERLPALAAELVALRVDVLVTLATSGALAARQATTTVPVVVAAMADPARDGLVASLARPGGNITGSTFLGPELIPKRLGLLKEIVPGAARVAVLWHPGVYSERTMSEMVKQTETAAQRFGAAPSIRGCDKSHRFREWIRGDE